MEGPVGQQLPSDSDADAGADAGADTDADADGELVRAVAQIWSELFDLIWVLLGLPPSWRRSIHTTVTSFTRKKVTTIKTSTTMKKVYLKHTNKELKDLNRF